MLFFRWSCDVRSNPYTFKPSLLTELAERIGNDRTQQLVVDFFHFQGDRLTMKAIEARMNPDLIDLIGFVEHEDGFQMVSNAPFQGGGYRKAYTMKLGDVDIHMIETGAYECTIAISASRIIQRHVTYVETYHKREFVPVEEMIFHSDRAEAAEKRVAELELLLAQATAQIYRQGSHTNS